MPIFAKPFSYRIHSQDEYLLRILQAKLPATVKGEGRGDGKEPAGPQRGRESSLRISLSSWQLGKIPFLS